jgi:hypothetical protein
MRIKVKFYLLVTIICILGVIAVFVIKPPNYLTNQEIIQAAERCMKKGYDVKYHTEDGFKVHKTECVKRK